MASLKIAGTPWSILISVGYILALGKEAAADIPKDWWIPRIEIRAEMQQEKDAKKVAERLRSADARERSEAALRLAEIGGPSTAHILSARLEKIEANLPVTDKAAFDPARKISKAKLLVGEWLAVVHALGKTQTPDAKQALLNLWQRHVKDAASERYEPSPFVPILAAIAQYKDESTAAFLRDVVVRKPLPGGEEVCIGFALQKYLAVALAIQPQPPAAQLDFLLREADTLTSMVRPDEPQSQYLQHRGMGGTLEYEFEKYFFSTADMSTLAPEIQRLLKTNVTPEAGYLLCISSANWLRRLPLMWEADPARKQQFAFTSTHLQLLEAVVDEWVGWPKLEKESAHVPVSTMLYSILDYLPPSSPLAERIKKELRPIPSASLTYPKAFPG